MHEETRQNQKWQKTSEEETRQNQKPQKTHENEEAKEREVEQLEPRQPTTQPMQVRHDLRLKRNKGRGFVEGGKDLVLVSCQNSF